MSTDRGWDGLPDYMVLDAGIEQLPREEIRKLQEERLIVQLHYIYTHAPFYREKFQKAGVSPDSIRSIDDLEKLPFTTKEELQEDQKKHPPFGSYAASNPSSWRRLLATSGTTGQPLKRVVSARDWGYVVDKFCRRSPTVRTGEIAVSLRSTDALWGMVAAEVTSRQGAMLVNLGRFDSRTKIKFIHELKPATASGTASYLLYLGELAKEMKAPLAKVGSFRMVSSSGEPGAAIPATRKRIEEMWGVSFVSDGYGLTEVFPLGGNCPYSASLHLCDDFIIAEVVDIETGKKLGPGQRGELVYTNIIGDSHPLIRFRTRDIGTLTFEPCQCGCTHTRILNGIEGRLDDLIWYKGMNIYPTAIEGVVRGFTELSGEFQILLQKRGPAQEIRVKAEVKKGVSPSRKRSLKDDLAQELKATVLVNVAVELLPEKSLPRAEYKARRVIDLR